MEELDTKILRYFNTFYFFDVLQGSFTVAIGQSNTVTLLMQI